MFDVNYKNIANVLEVGTKEILMERQCSGNHFVNFEIFPALDIILLRRLFFPYKPLPGHCKPPTTNNYLLRFLFKLQYRSPQTAFPSVAFHSLTEC